MFSITLDGESLQIGKCKTDKLVMTLAQDPRFSNLAASTKGQVDLLKCLLIGFIQRVVQTYETKAGSASTRSQLIANSLKVFNVPHGFHKTDLVEKLMNIVLYANMSIYSPYLSQGYIKGIMALWDMDKAKQKYTEMMKLILQGCATRSLTKLLTMIVITGSLVEEGITNPNVDERRTIGVVNFFFDYLKCDGKPTWFSWLLQHGGLSSLTSIPMMDAGVPSANCNINLESFDQFYLPYKMDAPEQKPTLAPVMTIHSIATNLRLVISRARLIADIIERNRPGKVTKWVEICESLGGVEDEVGRSRKKDKTKATVRHSPY